MEYFMDRMKAISSLSDSLNILIRYGILQHDLNRHVDQGRLLEAHELLKHNAEDIGREAAQLPVHRHGQLMFGVVRVWLNVSKYSAALKVINSVLNQPASATNHSLHVLFQLNLMVNALMNNRDYLHYAVRAMDRKLKSERKLHGTEQLILKLIKRWIILKPLKDVDDQVAVFQKILLNVN